MGKFEDYFESLDLTAIDPQVAVQTLVALHSEDIDTTGSKIASLETSTAEKDRIIAEREAEITRVKARNWDLVNQVTVKPTANEKPGDNGGDDNDPSTITMDAFFQKD